MHSRAQSLEASRRRRRARRPRSFTPIQAIPYLLTVILLASLIYSVLVNTTSIQVVRIWLLMATIVVIGLVVVLQLRAQISNRRLTMQQADAMRQLEQVNKQIEEQARFMEERNRALERGVAQLKDVQAHLANGNLHVRAHVSQPDLVPLTLSLNRLADRLSQLNQSKLYAQQVTHALVDLNLALERTQRGAPFMLPPSCKEFPEIARLLIAVGLDVPADPITDPYVSSALPTLEKKHLIREL